MYYSKINLKSNRAFAVLFSIMLASFLITLGISIFSISLKETMITTSVRDSQIAYYAADSARECALYWDAKMGAFPACFSSDCSSNSKSESDTITEIKCNGITVSKAILDSDNTSQLKFTKPSANVYRSNKLDNFFKASSTSDVPPMADIQITKEWVTTNIATGEGYLKTTIDTWGHNTGIIGRRVERGIRQINNN